MHVYVAINGERDYQDRKHGDHNKTHHKHTPMEWVAIMEHYLNKAKAAFTSGQPTSHNDTMDAIRKVAASGVCCMEQNGIVYREDSEPKCDVCGDTEEQHRTEKGYDHEFGGINDPDRRATLIKKLNDGFTPEGNAALTALLHDQHGDLKTTIKNAINRFSAENGSNTPDFILAEYLIGALELFDATTKDREKWYGREPKPVPPDQAPPRPDVVGKPFLSSI